MSASNAGSQAASNRCHILLVDDDEGFGEALGHELRSAGYQVSIARDFRVALDILEADRPIDLLITDIVMPASVNGLALARMARLRRTSLKVIYMTGYNIPGIERELLGPVLFKPIEDGVLLKEIEQLLGPQRPAPT